MKRAKIWSVVAEDVKMVLTVEEKKILFETAGTRDEWLSL